MLSDGNSVEAGHIGDPHPFVGGRIKVDVVDPDSELLDEAEAPSPNGPPGQRRPHRDDYVDDWPAIDQTRFELALADHLDHGAAHKTGGPVLRHLGPSVILGEPLLADEHPQRPFVGVVSMDRSGHCTSSEIRRTGTVRRLRVGGSCARQCRFRRCLEQLGAAGGDHRQAPWRRYNSPACWPRRRPPPVVVLSPKGSLFPDGRHSARALRTVILASSARSVRP